MGESNTSGIGFFSLLGLLFIGLKLTEVIDWSWWWVLSPFWGPLVFCAVISLKDVQAVRNGMHGQPEPVAPAERAFWETPREVTHAEAEAAARRLVNSHFRNPDSARVSIPANPNQDDDLVLLSYIAQRARAGDPQAAAALDEIKA